MGEEEHLADDPMLLTVALPQRDHLPPQDLVLPGEKAWEGAEASESSRGHHRPPPEWQGRARIHSDDRSFIVKRLPQLGPLVLEEVPRTI